MAKRQSPDEEALFSGLAKDLHELVLDKDALHTACENFLTNLIDELTLGIIFDQHRKYKTNAFDLDANNCASGEQVNEEVFDASSLKNQDCVCPICDKSVGASRFAPHLEKCMGMGRSRASRRVNSSASSSKDKDSSAASVSGNSSSYTELASDDEDTDWNPRYKRKRIRDKNGKKKSKGTSRKGGDNTESSDVNVDVEGDEDELSGLRYLLHEHSNSSSPAESVSSSASSSTKRKDKSKTKKGNRKDRASPNSAASTAD